MATRVQKQKESPTTRNEETEATPPSKQADLSDTDALLDEVDAVLEENAADFVKDYVQKGGQ